MRLLSVHLPQLLSRPMAPPLKALMHRSQAPQLLRAAHTALVAMQRQMRTRGKRELCAQWALALLKLRGPWQHCSVPGLRHHSWDQTLDHSVELATS